MRVFIISNFLASVFLLYSCVGEDKKKALLRGVSLEFYGDVNKEASTKSDQYWLPLSEVKDIFLSSGVRSGSELYVLRSSKKGEGVLCANLDTFLVKNGDLGFIFPSANPTSGTWLLGAMIEDEWEKVSVK